MDRDSEPWQDAIRGPDYSELSPLLGFVEKLQTAEETVRKGPLVGDGKRFSIRWPAASTHSYRMAIYPRERYGYPTDFRFDGDRLTAVPFAWADAFNGRYAYDFIGERFVKRGSDRSAERIVWSRLGFVMWDAPRVDALKRSPPLSHFATGWASMPP